MADVVFNLKNFDVRFDTPEGEVYAVRRVGFDVREGECLGVVGESGSGKSQMFMGALGLLARNGLATGSVRYRGQEILGLPERKLNQIRGAKISMIFQDPLTSLTPHMHIGGQIIETLRTHQKMGQREAERRALDMLELVRIPEAARRMRQYPHELSGGMRQRVMIAMATVCGPDLLIADEPTTALDVTVQAQILEIMRDLRKRLNTSVVIISHDMGVIASMCDRVLVMREGEFVEAGSADDIFYRPKHDYTRMLLEAMPRLDEPDSAQRPMVPPLADRESRPTILSVQDAKVYFPVRTSGLIFPKYKQLRAIDGVSFELKLGETLGVVGESGCGKSTLARAILRLLPATAGTVLWCGTNLDKTTVTELRRLRKDLQIVFQDPLASLDPRMTVGESIAEPLRTLRSDLSAVEITNQVRAAMEKVGLDPLSINRYPHEFSGGQNQRVGVARAVVLQPKLVICDEAVSALDVSIQAQIINLIIGLQTQLEMSLIFISHDLSVVRQVSHRVMVLYLGRIVELADRHTIYLDPRHPYTKALISAVLIPDPKIERSKPKIQFAGDLPSPLDSRAALTFLKSKIIDDPDAEQYVPKLIEITPDHFVAEHDPMP
ncbi:MAG: ABC transporter ATP-binding protein [Acidobacteriia bacterium]|nr:ABC transporter ATP-binding protein [Terriglobia bacterium]